MQKQLAEVARGVLLAAPCDGDVTRSPPELQKLPKGRGCWTCLNGKPSSSLAKRAWQAWSSRPRKQLPTSKGKQQRPPARQQLQCSSGTQNAAQQHRQQGQQSAGAADDDEDIPELGEQEVVDVLGDLLSGSSAGDGDGDAANRREAAKKLLRLITTRTVASRKPRKICLKKDGSGG